MNGGESFHAALESPPMTVLPVLLVLLTASVDSANTFGHTRVIDGVYTATIAELAGDAPVRYWVPLPVARDSQDVEITAIVAPGEWTRAQDPLFGNDYITGEVSGSEPIEVKVRFTATRREVTLDSIRNSALSRAEIARNLRADRLVTLSPRILDLADTITRGIDDPLEQGRAIYRYVLENMKYDKTAAGWGRGDTERACDVKLGNCTDFHSLFMSLARARGIPARFVIGFSLPDAAGASNGYHCWAEFHVEGRGWIPVDASDASKSSDDRLRDYLFGNLDPNRLEFTRGRDLRLTPETSEPLNFFIYPIAQHGTEVVGTPSIRLDYTSLPAARE